MTTRPPAHLTRPDGTRIAYDDRTPPHPSRNPPEAVLLLHGLAGHRGEWNDLAARLHADGHRVVTYDARGHGESTRRPREVTREFCAVDAAALIEQLSLTPATLIGQSLGGSHGDARRVGTPEPGEVPDPDRGRPGDGIPGPLHPDSELAGQLADPVPFLRGGDGVLRSSSATRPGRRAWNSGRTAGGRGWTRT
ncbi:alpha/beta hydrolase family protein [Streptomyces sp. NPDC005202]|uniref:alpha/beta hydrolase n=1 Tax=Streptomyces sp. NPDC005202 TaxID=3157021 RepID=UPI0033BF78EB